MTGEKNPPPRRIPSAPGIPSMKLPPSVVTEEEAAKEKRPISDKSELVLRELKDIESRAKEHAHAAIVELTALYERQLAERDRVIETLRQGDNTLNEAVAQLREENLRIREESAALITSAVTLEVSKHFVTEDQADTKIKGAGRLTQVKSLLAAILAALVSSGALVQITQSCSHGKQPAAETPPRGPGYGGRP